MSGGVGRKRKAEDSIPDILMRPAIKDNDIAEVKVGLEMDAFDIGKFVSDINLAKLQDNEQTM